LSQSPGPDGGKERVHRVLIRAFGRALKLEVGSPEGRINWGTIVFAVAITIVYLLTRSIQDAALLVDAANGHAVESHDFNLTEILWTVFAFAAICIVMISLVDLFKSKNRSK
jgi:uncharacterized membrane protein